MKCYLFAEASGYKANISKSTLMGVNIAHEDKDAVTAFLTAPWKTRVEYLGLKLPDQMDVDTLIDLNLLPVMNMIGRS